MREKLIAIGYWYSKYSRFSKKLLNPVCLEGECSYNKNDIIRYLKSGYCINNYLGHSFCRFNCGIDTSEMGNKEFTDGVFVWPEGYVHYIEVHNINVPDFFLNHILLSKNQANKINVDKILQEEGFNFSLWLEWCNQYKKPFLWRIIKKLRHFIYSFKT